MFAASIAFLLSLCYWNKKSKHWNFSSSFFCSFRSSCWCFSLSLKFIENWQKTNRTIARRLMKMTLHYRSRTQSILIDFTSIVSPFRNQNCWSMWIFNRFFVRDIIFSLTKTTKSPMRFSFDLFVFFQHVEICLIRSAFTFRDDLLELMRNFLRHFFLARHDFQVKETRENLKEFGFLHRTSKTLNKTWLIYDQQRSRTF